MNALDTNIWLYRHDIRDPDKQQKSKRLIDETRPLALLWQVGCEFIAASRKLEPFGFSQDDAWDALTDMQVIADSIILPTLSLVRSSQSPSEILFSFWDALIVAACVRAGITTLYTEDMGAPRVLDGLSLVNPF